MSATPWVSPDGSIDAAALAAASSDPLGAARRARYDQIDARTAQIIAAGFAYSGLIFSLSEFAQLNILAMAANPSLGVGVAWPSIDDVSTLTLPDTSTVSAFASAAISAVRTARIAGLSLKAQVRVATTIDAVVAVVDSR